MSVTHCEHCGATLGIGGRSGPTPRFCSSRCRTAAHRSWDIPTPMRQRDRWVTWMLLPNRPPKPCWIPNSWIGRDMTDPANWESWERAKSVRPGRRGFMLGDGIGMVTITDCVVRGKVDEQVLAQVDSFAQITWDGTGVQVLGWLDDTPAEWITWHGLRAQRAAGARYWVPLTAQRVGSIRTLAKL
ncbi:hypothetical protein PP404_16050 [Mycobacteroides abscessus]|nr:hypothetical protein [Mycobacteroides abscessus]MDM2176304.1 hypothetical protein [Mycobacteroides abscessus]MDM2222908.1 hypothetical protein [Mycobacteroides abscessus]MDM2239760.1 hypothetical protein [Mycobacteroides abscessus]MDM2250269.1 hypothetical protein [Mycobacteroides abscessus]